MLLEVIGKICSWMVICILVEQVRRSFGIIRLLVLVGKKVGTNVSLGTSTDFVGIGTDTPGSSLHIDTSVADGVLISSSGVAVELTFEDESDSDTFFLVFLNRGSDRLDLEMTMLIRTPFLKDGKVGIGTTAPEELLHVQSGNSIN